MLRPIVQGFWIEIGPVRPHQCMHLGIDADLIEQRQVAQRCVDLAGQDGPEVDDLLSCVVEPHRQGVGRRMFE